MVLVWHFIGEVFTPNLGITSRIVYGALILGRTGVDLFFVLSGFLIIGILIDRRQSPNLLQVFYIRRIARIIPPYILLIALFWTITSFARPGVYFNSSIPLAYYLTFTQNWWMSINNDWGPGASSVTWSVSIEEQFYMFFPFVVLLTPPRLLGRALISLAMASAAARAGFHYIYPALGFAPYVNTFLRIDALCIGGLVALAVRDPATMLYLRKRRTKILRIVFCLLAILPLFLCALNTSAEHTMYYWGHSYLALLYGMLLLLIIMNKGSSQTSILRLPVLKFFGSISYSAYLFHPMIIGTFFMMDGRTETLSSLRDAALLAGAFGSTVVFCWLLLRLVEGRLIRFGHRFRYGEQPDATILESLPSGAGRS